MNSFLHRMSVIVWTLALVLAGSMTALAAPPAQAGDGDPNAIACDGNALGDRVWHDMDGDGYQDEDEPGVDGVTVKLYRSESDHLISSKITSGGGYYRFEGLDPRKSYYVKFFEPSGYEFTIKDAGCGDAADSDADPATGKTIPLSVPKSVKDLTWDAGLVGALSLGNLVWNDRGSDSNGDSTSGNGVQDPGEPGFAGVAMWLFSRPCSDVDITVDPYVNGATDASGFYLFTGLTPGRYCIIIPPSAFQMGGPLGGYDTTLLHAGGDDALDSDAEKSLYPASEYAYVDAVLTDHDDNTFDFGFVIGGWPTAVTLTAMAVSSAATQPWAAFAWGALGIAGMAGLAWGRRSR